MGIRRTRKAPIQYVATFWVIWATRPLVSTHSTWLGFAIEPLPFFEVWFSALESQKTKLQKKGEMVGVAFTQDGGLGGLVLGYYLAAP